MANYYCHDDFSDKNKVKYSKILCLNLTTTKLSKTSEALLTVSATARHNVVFMLFGET